MALFVTACASSSEIPPWFDSIQRLPIRTVMVEGNRVAYLDVGDGPPVILIHGLGGSMWQWEYQQGPLANYMPYSTLTEPTLQRLAALQPKTLATMHGSAFVGDGARALHDLASLLKDILGSK